MANRMSSHLTGTGKMDHTQGPPTISMESLPNVPRLTELPLGH
jgi:hypothetical protein